jgi:hypothetical protein
MLRSCSNSSAAAVTGVFGELRNELGLPGALGCFAPSPGALTGGVADAARPSLPLSNWAFNSAALALICVSRGGVGAVG